MVQAIHTAVPGRARYRVDGLYRSEALKQYLEARLSSCAGIHRVAANPMTGNILVSFSPANSAATVASLIATVLAEFHGRDGSRENSSGSVTALHPAAGGNGPSSARWAPQQAAAAHREGLAVPVPSRPDGHDGQPWHLREGAAVLAALQTSGTEGLSQAAAEERLRRYGPNVLPETMPRSDWEILLDQFNSLPVALLGAAAGVALLTGGLVDALVILGVVAMNATIGYFTESQSERTLQSLKHLARPTALVLRDGKPVEVSADTVVVGDLLVLKPGSYVAADARLIAAHRLSVDESTLTGESLPVVKTAEPLTNAALPLADRVNMVYRGTLVTGGQGLAVVVATGHETEIGQIQLLAGEARTPETPMERQLHHLGTRLVLLGSAVCGAVFVIGLLRGYGFLPMLQAAISLAVAAVPEGLPTVATTTLALGVRTMRRHRVLVRSLDAVEALGCVQTVCLDKTGTLTLNRMSVVALHTGMRRIRLTEDGFAIGEMPIDPLACVELTRLVQICALCSETELVRQGDRYVLRGSPTENALVEAAIRAGVDVVQLREHFPTVKVDLRAENRNFVRTLHRSLSGGTGMPAPPFLVAVKGSPAEVLALCRWHLVEGRQVPLTDDDRFLLETENERMAGEALRVLGVAYAERDSEGEQSDDGPLTWLGLIGMVDPIRTGVQGVIRAFHQAGITTVMITGDQSPTAYAIGKELNLSGNGELEILDSTHLAQLDPAVLTALAQKVHVFARVSPAPKLQIVQALQRAGQVVAMTGDGINDGPALKAADIGIAMGHAGTDVAREVADVVLEDDDLETMIVAIRQGRTIYHNMRKSLRFLLTTNLSELIVTCTALAAGLGQPLNPMQLLWINLISDVAPGLALALEPPEPEVMHQPPRDPSAAFLQAEEVRRIVFESAMLSAGALGAYGYGLWQGGAGARAGSLAFLSLTSGQLLHALTARSETHSVFNADRLPPNPYLTAALGGSFALQTLTLLLPGLRTLLGMTPISVTDAMVVAASVLLPFTVNELTKNHGSSRRESAEHDAEPRRRARAA